MARKRRRGRQAETTAAPRTLIDFGRSRAARVFVCAVSSGSFSFVCFRLGPPAGPSQRLRSGRMRCEHRSAGQAMNSAGASSFAYLTSRLVDWPLGGGGGGRAASTRSVGGQIRPTLPASWPSRRIQHAAAAYFRWRHSIYYCGGRLKQQRRDDGCAGANHSARRRRRPLNKLTNAIVLAAAAAAADKFKLILFDNGAQK